MIQRTALVSTMPSPARASFSATPPSPRSSDTFPPTTPSTMTTTSTHRSTPTRATSSGCTSSRYADARAAVHTTGLSVPTRIPERRLAAVIPGSTTTPALRVRSSAREAASAAMLASTHTACSSAGFIRRGTGLSHARTARLVDVACASSLTRRSSSVFSRSLRYPAPKPPLIPTMDLHFVTMFLMLTSLRTSSPRPQPQP